ncbi:MAG: CHRD domain-containing protein, partial [Gammaproteobacteria bacterium]|nr:CHRD domain-containing protein [Gammaproteobacteria bacterium]
MIKELLTGNLYLNVHTAANPAGEIRGQVLLSEGTSLSTGLTDEQEVHTVDTSATGTANFTLTDAGLAFNVTVEGLSGPIQAAHFHNAAAGVDGGVVRTITNDFDGNTASGLWTPMDTEPLTDQLIDELLRGNLYLNIHTTNNPAGEVRGQIYGSGGTDLTASLTPEQEVHNVTSSASGSAAFTLTDAGLAFKLTVNDLSGPIQAAHFHHASAGVDGGVVRTISGDFDGNTASGLWTADDSEPLTDSLRNALLAGDIYLNVHTANNPPGEIRGQVFLSGGVGFTSRLNSEQEVHPVTSDGMGTSALTLSDAGLIFDITVEGLSGSINAAHFHNAPRGQDGPVVRTITDDLNGNTGFGVWRSSDSEPLTIDLTRELLDRNIYYNVHTGTYP